MKLFVKKQNFSSALLQSLIAILISVFSIESSFAHTQPLMQESKKTLTPPKMSPITCESLLRISSDQVISLLQKRYHSPSAYQPLLRGNELNVGVAMESVLGKTTGDFFRAIQVSKGKVALVLGDATGHDLKSAGISSELHRFFDLAEQDEIFLNSYKESSTSLENPKANDPASSALSYLDKVLYEKNIWKHLVEKYEPAMALAQIVIDRNTSTIHHANGGLPNLIIRRENGRIEIGQSAGYTVGDGGSFELSYSGGQSVKLSKGDTVFFYTDGLFNDSIFFDGTLDTLTESSVAKNEDLTSIQRMVLIEEIKKLDPKSLQKPQTIAKTLLSKFFRGQDDATMVVLHW